ncbi:hypothetical protein KU306_05990 [Haloferax larsenii]|uniref:Uncharacterized protein n=1 Tax=Haloferax larsenii TaxID=302484 RepID=A0ABY5RGC0_HALLR|nr:hypothetical protein [Haloferax larsenii]UVE51427.1 hypothetical protein KU306_05990 [Haloferax larsenii]
MSDGKIPVFKATQDIVGGAFGGLVVLLVQDGTSDLIVGFFTLFLIGLLTLSYGVHDLTKAYIKPNKEEKNEEEESDSDPSDEVDYYWPPHRAS